MNEKIPIRTEFFTTVGEKGTYRNKEINSDSGKCFEENDRGQDWMGHWRVRDSL